MFTEAKTFSMMMTKTGNDKDPQKGNRKKQQQTIREFVT